MVPKKSNVVRRYVAVGAGFGALFPIFSMFLGLSYHQLDFSLANLVWLQLNDPLYWVIDTAPFFLGLFAYFAGARQERVNQINRLYEQQAKERDQAVVELKSLRASLENQIDRHVEQLRTTAEVAREASEIHDVKQLMDVATTLVSNRYHFYHTGIFLLDEAGEFAVLKATNSEGGRRMLERGHRLRVGHEGIVGFVAQNAQPRIARDVGADAIFFNNPDLPATRSELALPLSVRGEVIGVLDVQSVEAGAFSQQDLETLQLLADQLALAIDNARLYENSQRALEEIGKLYGNLSQEAWQKFARERTPGYRYTSAGIEPVRLDENSPEPAEAQSSKLAVPLVVRGQTIGTILLRRDENQPTWTQDDQTLLRDTAAQIASALENTRLMEEIQLRAQQERTIGQITAKTQSSLDLDTVIQTAVREIGLAFHLPRVQIRVGTPGQPAKQPGPRQAMQEPLQIKTGNNGKPSTGPQESTNGAS